MWSDRLKRLLIFILVMVLVVAWVGQVLSQSVASGQSPAAAWIKQAENWGERVLGKAVEKLPGSSEFADDQVNQDGEEEQTSEPIEEPVKKIETQTQALLEAIKKLPEDQIEAIRKQITKEICGELNE